MSEIQKYQLEEFIFDLTEIPASDILVNLDFTKKDIFEIETELEPTIELDLENPLAQILKVAIHNKRNSDTETLCIAINGLHWEYKGKQVISPLILMPIKHKINKAKQTLTLHLDFENYLFNPFILNEIKRTFELGWEMDEHLTISENLKAFHGFIVEHELNFKIQRFKFLGNFHHHRYQIVKDLEALKKQEQNHLVNEILGENSEIEPSNKNLTNFNLLPVDKDQLTVFEKIKSGNLVIQGPPGTGKSQVLTNLLAKLLHAGKMNLVVSEKKVALEVLVKKLAQFELDDFTFISQSQVKSHDLIQKLKNTWQKLEQPIENPTVNLLLSDQLLAQLQLTIDKMLTKNLIGGVSLETFRNLIQHVNLDEITFSSQVPTIETWLEQKSEVEAIYKSWGGFEKIKILNQHSIREFVNLDTEVRQLKAQFEKFSNLFEVENVGQLIQLCTQIPRFQIVENEIYKKYAPVFSSPKARNKFEKLKNQWLIKEAEFELTKSEEINWKTAPTWTEIESWKIQLSASWWTRKKTIRLIKSKLANQDIVPEIAIENWKKYLLSQEEIQKLKSQFIAIGIERPALEIESISYIVKQLENDNSNELNHAFSMDENKRKVAIQASKDLENFHQTAKNLFNYDLHKITLKNLIELEQDIEEIILHKKQLINFDSNIYNLIKSHKNPEEIEKIILKSHWVNFESNWPELAKFDGQMLLEKIQNIIESEQVENLQFAKEICARQKQKFHQYHAVLRNPNSKLSTAEKALKSNLKIGKSILVKEFSKSKQHKTIRELLSSEARIWIEVLTPIWLSTPGQVAVTFPMEKSLFEWVIFDEASQIPLANALGSLQRAERAIIAGDEQQMSPSNFFSSQRSNVDLLHQANYYYPKTKLKHHYRSNHPALITFSNRFFYQNELIAYPAATENKNPLNFHKIEEGQYVNRQNITEAKKVAEWIEKSISKKETLGIVAFSEKQLDCIWRELSVKTQQKIVQNTELGNGFFKALEQVQGDECDVLIISFGYAPNELGEFHKKFGPLNQKNGSKRLNVLLSRAKKRIHFFSSITSKDLEISSNESINLLRYFLNQLETENEDSEFKFPYDLEVTIENQDILNIHRITNKINDARELVTTHHVLSQRGWKINYQF